MRRETEPVVDEKTTQRKIRGVARDMFKVSFTMQAPLSTDLEFLCQVEFCEGFLDGLRQGLAEVDHHYATDGPLIFLWNIFSGYLTPKPVTIFITLHNQ
ncbi:hypothetical protein YC2023_082685 [Brassica napus]